MLTFVEGQTNTVTVFVSSSIDITGYSIVSSIGGVTKTLSNIKDGTYSLTFSTSDIANIPSSPSYAPVVVKDGNGNDYQTLFVETLKVPQAQSFKAVGNDSISIVIVANWVGQDPGGGDSPDTRDFVRKSDFRNIGDPKNTINSNTEVIKEILSAAKGS